jgi:ribosome recycling factor
MISMILEDAETRMGKTVDSLRQELKHIRTGKANPALLDNVRVSAYGQEMPLRQVASIAVPDPRQIVVQPWDKSILSDVEKAIQKADLGLNPTNDGSFIRLPIPPLTEERRRDLVKAVKKIVEDSKIALRNIRRDANEQLKSAEKDGDISEDESRRGLDKVQNLIDKKTAELEEILKRKEQEIMEV